MFLLVDLMITVEKNKEDPNETTTNPSTKED